MYKRPFIIFSILLLSFLQVLAHTVNQTDALQLATNFLQLRSPSNLRSVEALKLVYQGNSIGLRSAADPTFYIYNIGDNQGFVIVSGEDATKTILGYADEGSFRTDNMPENVKYWLNFYQQEIGALREASVAGSVAASEQVSTIAAGSPTVAPLLGGIKWNQTDPFNLLCPWDTKAKLHALAGCVAIAMSQIMKYHHWPVTGTGSYSYKDTNYGAQTVNFSHSTYDWNAMLGAYNSSSTAAQDSAVAELVYQCGVAVNMNYSLTGSSSTISNAADAFVSHFGYDTEIQCFERPYYSVNEWTGLIKNELNNARPVYYSANSDAGGHAFVCDGYDSNNLFHINWGWGGSFNGYFELSSLSSANPGVTGAAPEYAYLQSILTGIHKADAINRVTYQVAVVNTGLSSSQKSVSKISTKPFNLSYSCENIGTNDMTARWGIGFIKDGSNTLTKLVEYSPTTFTPLTIDYSYSNTFTINNPTGLSTAGTYRLYPIYCPSDSVINGTPRWSIMRGTPVLNNCMIVTVASNGSATILPALEAPSLALTKSPEPLTRLYQNKAINVDLTFQNDGSEFYSRVALFLISTTDPGDRTYICESKVLCPAGETMTYHLTGTVISLPGSYYLQAQFDSTNSNSTMNYKVFGPSNKNSKEVEVLPQPGTPMLELNKNISMANGTTIARNDSVDLTFSISNSGGYFDSRIIAFVFPQGGGRSLTYLTPQYVYIDSLETKNVTLTGTIDLDAGDYFFSMYQFLNDSWASLSPYGMSSLNFTVTNGPVVIKQSTEPKPLLIHQSGNQLLIETTAEISESRLFDLSGRLIRKIGSERAIQIGDLAPGVYLLRVQTNGKLYMERFLKYGL
jgi:hypothetical protein